MRGARGIPSTDSGMGILGMRGKEVAVVGLGVSNLPVARLLLKEGASVHLFDQRPLEKLDHDVKALIGAGARSHLGPHYLEALSRGIFDALVLTPGMKKGVSQVEVHRRRGALITSEIDLFLRLTRCRTLGVTGSAGKTTTTTLVHQMLDLQGLPVTVGGNIGLPLIEKHSCLEPGSWAVLELSSFQLETCTVSPHIAVLLNLYTDHLDIHPDLRSYWEAKSRIFRFQGPDDYLVLNLDQEEVSGLTSDSAAQIYHFSLHQRPARGVYLQGRDIMWSSGQGVSRLGSAGDLGLRGRHNVANFLAAALAGLLAGVSAEKVMEVARSFTGIPHRLEEVRELEGVVYVNDSIATTPDRTRAALESFQGPVVLIAGGYDKGLCYKSLGTDIATRAKALVLLGDTADCIQEAVREAGGDLSIVQVASLQEAVVRARSLARPGDVVLMSPASASFDMFRSYVHRGDVFRQLVMELAPAGVSS